MSHIGAGTLRETVQTCYNYPKGFHVGNMAWSGLTPEEEWLNKICMCIYMVIVQRRIRLFEYEFLIVFIVAGDSITSVSSYGGKLNVIDLFFH